MRAFSNSERKALLQSPFVSKITSRNQVQFTDDFKSLMIKGSSQGLTQVEFFNSTLGVACFDKNYIDTCLNRWRIQIASGVYKDQRGKNKSTSKMTIEELEAVIAYQSEVIKNLKKHRGLTDDDI